MLTTYQETVRSLLNESYHPGVSAEELEMFKSHFRTSAFTCRLKSCPRATLGFETHKCQFEHEMTHLRKFRCTVPGCQFPHPVSAQALKNHNKKYHSPDTAPISIRDIPTSSAITTRVAAGVLNERQSVQQEQVKNAFSQTGLLEKVHEVLMDLVKLPPSFPLQVFGLPGTCETWGDIWPKASKSAAFQDYVSYFQDFQHTQFKKVLQEEFDHAIAEARTVAFGASNLEMRRARGKIQGIGDEELRWSIIQAKIIAWEKIRQEPRIFE